MESGRTSRREGSGLAAFESVKDKPEKLFDISTVR
jgi:hypothetical protein